MEVFPATLLMGVIRVMELKVLRLFKDPDFWYDDRNEGGEFLCFKWKYSFKLVRDGSLWCFVEGTCPHMCWSGEVLREWVAEWVADSGWLNTPMELELSSLTNGSWRESRDWPGDDL